MKIRNLAVTLVLGATACTLPAQQTMPDMPGMKPGMKMDPPPPRQPAKPNMGPENTHNPAKPFPHTQQAPQVPQIQQVPQTQATPTDTPSLTVPIQQLQEPEAPGFETGSDLPAPELLREVVHRDPLTVETLLALAEANNPTLAQARRNIDRSAAQARQQGLPPDPVIGYSGDHIRGGQYGGGEEGAFFSQVFVLGHKLALRRGIYRAEGRSNEFALEVQRARVRDDIARSFFHTLALQESVVLHGRLLAVALDTQTNAHELERVGQADASDVLNVEIAAEGAKADFEESQRLFLAGFAELATYAGQTALPAHPLTGGLVEPPELDAEAMVATDMQRSPYVQQAQADVTAAEARLKDAKRERVPNITIKAGEWYSGESLNAVGTAGSPNRKAGWESFAEAGVQLPLWNRNQGNTQAAEALLARAQGNVTRTQLWTRNQAEPYAQEYLAARSTADRYRTAMLPRARRAYQLEVTKYQQMALAYPHVLTAQHMLFTLQLGYIQALDREWRAALALQNYTLTNALDAPLSTGDDTTTLNLPAGGQ